LKTTIYIEGGGDTRQLHSELRQGFKSLFESSGLKGRLPKVVACGSRNDAYHDFKIAFLSKDVNEKVLLLVDSEDLVGSSTKWEHVKYRDNWDKITGSNEEEIFFMTVCTESWFLADTEGMSQFFGRGFDITKLPQNSDLEEITKKILYSGLKNATKNSSKGVYGKGQHSFKILTFLNTQKVKNHGKYSKEFFEYLHEIL
jgi:hypothetical protein